MDNLLVVKFVGTSVGAADRIQQLPSIVAQLKKQYRTVVVVCSAMSKVTDLLIKAGEQAAKKNGQYEQTVTEIAQKHLMVYATLLSKNNVATKQLLSALEELKKDLLWRVSYRRVYGSHQGFGDEFWGTTVVRFGGCLFPATKIKIKYL
jgi:aspartokinase